MLAIMAMIFCVFAVSVSAHDITRKVTLDDGTVVPLYDADGNALTYYLDDEGNLVSQKTVDVISVNNNGVASYNGITTMKVVVANFQGAEVEALNVKQIPSYYYGANGGGYHSYNDTIEYVYLPDTLTTTVTNQFRCTSKLKIVDVTKNSNWTTMGQYCFYYATGLTEFYYPSKVKTTPGAGNDGSNGTAATFSHCTSLKSLYFYDNSEVETFGDACFTSCTSLETVVLPNTITSLPGNVFSGCTSLKEISLPNSIVTIANHAFAWCSSLKVIRLGASFAYFNNTGDNSFTYLTGNVEEIYLPKTFYATAPDTSLGYQVSYAFHGASSNCKFFYCGTTAEFETAKANFLTQKSATSNNGSFINATVITYAEYLANPNNYATGRYVICGYNTCDAFYDEKHDLGEVNSCMAVATCDRECGFSVTPDFEGHSVVETLVYANGFDKSGVYNCICENAEYCTAIEGYALNETKDPIITFKGYSNPETEAYLGINVGYFVDTLLLSEYTRITGESVTIGLFMVNGDIDVADIIDGKTLELADGAKGFSVKVINLNYSSISIEVRGFSKTGETEGSLGNYYTLKLVSAVVVTTTKGENTTTHFVQAGVDGADLETKTFNGFDFYLITADAVYGTPES